MPVQIGARPDSGFDDPLGMLVDCHRRIEHFLGILYVVVERAQGRSLTAEEKEAVEASLNYFRVGGVRHTADEEESLFPRMREKGIDVSSDLVSLEHDHLAADTLHRAVEGLYRKWIEAGTIDAAEYTRLSAGTSQLKQLYEAHIKMEENVIFPHAAQTLNKDTIHVIGEEFRRRRA